MPIIQDEEFRFKHDDSEAYAMALDLHALTMELVPESRGWRGLRAQLGRATMRIVSQIAEAAHLADKRSLRLLEKARVGCVNSCAAWDALRAANQLTGEQHRRARSLVHRLAQLITRALVADVPSSPPTQAAVTAARLPVPSDMAADTAYHSAGGASVTAASERQFDPH